MKHKLLFSALSLVWAGAATVSADVVSNYTCDFNTEIKTSSPDFRVAPNWKHIVDTYIDNYGWVFNMSYSYGASTGVGSSGALLAYEQKAGDNESSREVYDLLVTPEVKGTVTLQVKKYNEKSKLEIYSLSGDGTAKDEVILTLSPVELANGDWVSATLNLDDFQRIGIRGNYVYMDNFTASEANIEQEYSMEIVTAEPSNTTGSIKHNQNAEGGIDLIYTVTVKNTSSAPLIARKSGVTGTKNYSISIVGANNAPFGAPVYVPFDLQPGETSEPFEVKVVVPKDEISSWWSYSSQAITMNLRENLQGTITKRATAQYNPYESKFAFALKNNTSNISNPLPFGVVEDSKTVDFRILNEGVAPLTVKSISLPVGFTTTAPLGETIVAAGTALDVPVTFEPSAPGFVSGNLEIVYLDNTGKEVIKSLPISATKAPAGAWIADFNGLNAAVSYPVGVVAETAIQPKYDGLSGMNEYDVFLSSYTNSDYKDANNKFITPLLNVAAGAKAYFTVAADSKTAPYYVKVYTSSDRKNWGEPIAVYNAESEEFADGAFHGYFVALPEGEKYVGFAVYGMRLNDIVIDATPKDVEYDLHIAGFSQTEKVQSGKNFSASVDVIPVLGAEAGTYRVRYFLNDEVVAQKSGEALTASPNTRKKFDFSVAKEVETTTTFTGKIQFQFEDGPVFETEPLEVTVTNEPAFVFNTPGINDASTLPSSLNAAIDFGKVNEVGRKKEFEIFNWGTAPLKVTSITAPTGFASSISEATVPGKGHQPVDITFSTTTPATYSGNLEIKYLIGDEEKTYTLPVKGILLNPKKWYATFDNDENTAACPAGALYQKNVELLNVGSPNAANFVLNSSSSKSVSDRMFVTPLLKAAKGETLSFDAKLYSSSWKEGGVTVYAAKSREALLYPDASGNYPDRITLGDFSGESTEEGHTISTAFESFSVEMPEAGEYYIGFEIYSRVNVNDIFGLEKVNVPFDVIAEGASFSSYAMQNVAAPAKISVRNLGAPLEAGSYKIKAYVDGVATVIEDTEELPAVNKLSNPATELNVSFRSPKVGKFPVYFELVGEGKTVATEPMNVTFEEEVLSSEKAVGTYSGTISQNVPLVLNYHTSESLTTYTAAQLGFSGGEKIRSLAFKGYRSKWEKSKTPQVTVYYQWVDETSQPVPASSSAYNTDGMTLCYDAELETDAKGSSANHEEILKVSFETPMVAPAGKSLRLLVRSTVDGVFQNAYSFEVSNDIKNTVYHRDDVKLASLSDGWRTDVNSPVLYLDMVVEARSISGTVRDANDNVVADADITIISTDGDNVQYTGKSGADGKYSVSVIQSSREYSVSASANGKEDFINGVSAANASVTDCDLQLIDVISVSDDGDHSEIPANAVVYVEKALNPGFNAVALPIALTAEETEAIFGEDAIIMEFDQVTSNAPATVVNFNEVETKDLVAGKPYLIYIEKESKEVSFKTKGAVAPLKTGSTSETDFLATEKRTPVAEGMFVLDADNFVKAAVTRAAVELPAYSGYINAPNATSLTFTTNADIVTGIEEAEIVEQAEDLIYDLNGIRVKNPAKGIYIINGKPVMVK